MKAASTLLIATAFASTLLSACGSSLPAVQVAGMRQMQAQAAPRALSPDLQAQYFSVLLSIKYTPDTDGHHFGYDWMTISFADSHAKHLELNLAFNPQSKLFTLDVTRSGGVVGGQPVSEHVSMDNTARRAELANELRKLMGSDDDKANLARAIAVIAPSGR